MEAPQVHYEGMPGGVERPAELWRSWRRHPAPFCPQVEMWDAPRPPASAFPCVTLEGPPCPGAGQAAGPRLPRWSGPNESPRPSALPRCKHFYFHFSLWPLFPRGHNLFKPALNKGPSDYRRAAGFMVVFLCLTFPSLSSFLPTPQRQVPGLPRRGLQQLVARGSRVPRLVPLSCGLAGLTGGGG